MLFPASPLVVFCCLGYVLASESNGPIVDTIYGKVSGAKYPY